MTTNLAQGVLGGQTTARLPRIREESQDVLLATCQSPAAAGRRVCEVTNGRFVEAKLEKPALGIEQLWRSLTGGYESGPGLDERQLYGSPTRPAGFWQRVQGIGWPDPTPMHRSQLCADRVSGRTISPMGMARKAR